MQTDPAFKRTADEIVARMLEGAVAYGQIDPKGKSEEQVRAEFATLILAGPTPRFLFAIDHTDHLRNLAKRFEDKGKFELAILLYATWVEHLLNEIVSLGVSRRGLGDDVAKQIIRDVSLNAKLGWVPQLLEFPQLSQVHCKRLTELANRRNQFVHYKWTYEEFGRGSRDDKAAAKAFLVECRKSLAALARYRGRIRLSVPASKLRRVLHDGDS